MMVDPESESVSHLVIEKGMLLAQDTLVPVDQVQQVLHRGIFLNLTAEQALSLTEFNEHRHLQRERAMPGHQEPRSEPQPSHNGSSDMRGNGGGAGNNRRPNRRFRRH
jgi:hypothetical protein